MARTLVTAGAAGLRYSPMCSFEMNWGNANTGLSVKPGDPFRSHSAGQHKAARFSSRGILCVTELYEDMG